jgi:NADPH:quinone reductase-like Zn-dependent oxidoreductase
MRQVVIHAYGGAAEVLRIEEAPIPRIRRNEVLVRQHASSVNPIDCRMRDGSGRVLFSKLRGYELPLVLGRDVSGEVVEIGSSVTSVAVGESVYGVTRGKQHGGGYAEFVICSPGDIVAKPASLSFTEAAAFPYVACTVWAALVGRAGLGPHNAHGKKVFVQAGAGGIGSLAVQVLKAWGAHVATTCSAAQLASVRALGADQVIDYEHQDYGQLLSGFDVALETIGGPLEHKTLGILRDDGMGCFVTLIHPLIRNFDESGLVGGAARNLLAMRSAKQHARRCGVGSYHWAAYKPSAEALTAVRELIELGHVRPHIDAEFDLTQLAAAQEYCEQGRANGKVVLRIG